jgi:hypothetical protein
MKNALFAVLMIICAACIAVGRHLQQLKVITIPAAGKTVYMQ